ncbi:MAG TPA: putative O-glycosylation ligase, exosortase A system-associated [Aliidongia sp.]|uniref:putative O-glycosylation ligase, exosortase A system-associated n=1 Tax=Aliidongia sp. TaxID=1914230 RepID=UPI002DDD742A|nr:putative O-glycosylation ligase, exosortase A system-associated [Aliidongia sp.]HEV2676389.1 putative O-glycosylation ligase, exosortase A system-associated [Aliidongia sp.]
MRDLLIALVLLGSVPVILMRPYVGFVMWFVISFMNPHHMAYGFITTMPVAMLIGGATLVGFVLFREPKRMPIDATTALIMGLMVWITVSTTASLKPDLAWSDWNRAVKLLGMTLLMIPLLTNRQRLQGVIWAIVISVDFYGVRGGLFTIITGGGGRVVGPDDTMLSDNNQLATALIMILPLLRYLQTQTQNRYVRMGLVIALGLTIVSVFGSFSRGALIGLAVMFLWMIRSSRHKTTILLAAVFGVGALTLVMPESWYARMNTIQTYQDDGSVTGRFDAWKYAFRLAVERPLTGGGFHAYADTAHFFALVPEAPVARAFHSIYFEAMGEHGFVGLGLFLGVIGAGLFTTAKLRKATRKDPQQAWAYELASMVQVSIVGYMVAGAFLELTFFDLFYAIVILPTLAVTVLQREREAAQEPTTRARKVPRFRPPRQIGAKPVRS